MSEYLSVPKAFESEIARSYSIRSGPLSELVEAIKNYTTNKFPAGSEALQQQIRTVKVKYEAWKNAKPQEFNERFASKAKGFEVELDSALEEAGIGDGPDSDPVDRAFQLPEAPATAVSGWAPTGKRALKLVVTGTSLGISGYQQYTNTGMLAAVTGAAVGATGVGLIAGAAAAQVITSGLAIRAAVKTNRHIKVLQDLYNRREAFAGPDYCGSILDSRDTPYQTSASTKSHDLIANHVLPYIIQKKTSKLHRKVLTAAPVLGSGETVRAILKLAYKKARGTQGKHRALAARWLAYHFLSCDCYLTQAIISDLHSVEEMLWLRDQTYSEIAECLAMKIKST
jgi:hypothetical protein